MNVKKPRPLGRQRLGQQCRGAPTGVAARWGLPLAIACAMTSVAWAANSGNTEAAASDKATAHPENWRAAKSPFPRDEALERRVSELMAKMSLEEKVGQIVQGDFTNATPEDMRKYRLGSILGGGNSEPNGRYDSPPQVWLDIADAFYTASMDTSNGHNAIPALFGIDAVHGHNNLVGATLFPHNVGLGAMRNPELIRKIGEATAAEVRSTGIEWTFAPTLTVPRDDRWGRTYEGYSEDPNLVASYAGAMVEGLQGKLGTREFLDGKHVIASAKHFLADGGTFEGRDQGDAKISEAELRDIHGAGYYPALAAGSQTVMASFSSWNGVKMHGNHSLLTDVLKKRLDFDGFVIGDWNAQGQLPGCTNENCPAAFNAGVDMLMAPDSWKGYYENALAQVKSGVIPMARLDEAVARILRVKFRLGLFEAGLPSKRPLGGKFELLGSPEHRAIARQAVRESLVLIKNETGVLPISPRKRVLVAGDGADNLLKQAGGWTLNWQGTGLKPSDFPNAQSIWKGLQEQITAAGGQAELSPDGSFKDKPDVAIVVYGEDPYAEFQGDIATLAYKPAHNPDLELLKRLKAQGIPVVSVFLSGRVLWTNREINASDAFVAAWLPGSEGGGIADVLLSKRDGKVNHDFKGKLAYSWPRTAVQIVNVGDRDYSPQFAFGYGLTYASGGKVGTLPEDPGADISQPPTALWLTRGALPRSWNVSLTGADGQSVKSATVPVKTKDGSLSIRAVDRNAQEDAWKLEWKGTARAEWTPPSALDINRETNGDVAVLVTLKVDALGSGPVSLLADCEGETCGAKIPLTDTLKAIPSGQWQRVGVLMKCIRKAGANMARLTAPFGIEAGAGTVITVHEVRQGTDAERSVACAQ